MEDRTTFNIEVRVPFSQAAEFAAALTGNDDDIVLAAETAMRERLGRGADEEVELAFHGEFGLRSEADLREQLASAAERHDPAGMLDSDGLGA